MLSSLKYLLSFYLVSLQVLQGLYVPLIQGQDHVLISILDLAEAFEDLRPQSQKFGYGWAEWSLMPSQKCTNQYHSSNIVGLEN